MRDIGRLQVRVTLRISSECTSAHRYRFIYISQSHNSEHSINRLSYRVYVKIHYQNTKSNQQLIASAFLHYHK